ncbi:30S ribosomal protein S19 [archaeon]|nr:30S ribosomal protein S19 [archaeon]|tara:strand:+ start:9511 stop:9891 length:381 start_codon:yes stop_codon:yes gene_type:complete
MAKELKWNGLTEEQVKALSFEEFVTLLPARRRRSIKRGPHPMQERFFKKLRSGKNNIRTHRRNIIIIPEMLGKTFKVFTGKDFAQVIVNVEMLGHLLGEFASSRKLVSHSGAGVGSTRSSKAVTAR